MQVFIYCIITPHVSGVHRTHHQEYIKLLLQSLVQARFGHIGGRLLLRYLYQRLQ